MQESATEQDPRPPIDTRLTRSLRVWCLATIGLLLILAWLFFVEIQHDRLERPLITAIVAGNQKEVRRLLFYGANAESVDRPVQTRKDVLTILKSMFRPHDATSSVQTATALGVALTTERRSFTIVKLLVEAGADVNRRTAGAVGYWTESYPPLIFAAAWGEPRVVELLLAHGANASAKDAQGNTVLHSAASSGSGECVRMLVRTGCDVNAANRTGVTPIMGSTSVAALEALLQNGADINRRAGSLLEGYPYGSGWSALVNAAQKRDTAFANVYIAHHADVNSASDSKQTALMFASVKGLTAVAANLIAHGANVSARDKDGNTSLTDAARWGHIEIVRLLIDHGANVNTGTNIGWTPLMAAAYGGKPAIVKLLLAKGANSQARTKLGETALMDAADAGDLECANMLLSAGANPKDRDRKGNNIAAYATGNVLAPCGHCEDDRYDRDDSRNPGNPQMIRLLAQKPSKPSTYPK